MRKVLPLMLGLAACWTSSSTPARQPAPEPAAAATGGASYGGASYGGASYGEGVGLIGTSGLDASDGGGVGLGRSVGTIGGGGGVVGGFGVGRGGVIGHGGGAVGGGVVGGPAVSLGAPGGQTGALDPAIIRRYIRRNIAKIQLCYEQELAADPALAGKVTVRFSIGGDGKVTQSIGSGLPPVDACVAAVVATIAFPRPIGGGVVAVTYPFTFEPSQDAGPPTP